MSWYELIDPREYRVEIESEEYPYLRFGASPLSYSVVHVSRGNTHTKIIPESDPEIGLGVVFEASATGVSKLHLYLAGAPDAFHWRKLLP